MQSKSFQTGTAADPNSSSFVLSSKPKGEFKLIENVLSSPQFNDVNSACETLNRFDTNHYAFGRRKNTNRITFLFYYIFMSVLTR